MTDRKELTTVPSKPHDKLPNEQIEKEALDLINSNEEVLKKTPDFVRATVEQFFGKNPDGSPDHYASNSDNTVSFWHKGVAWEVTNTFRKGGQTMTINVCSPIGLPFQEVILTLRSSRKDQQPTTSALIQVTGISESPREPVIHRNTQGAIDIAKQLLIFYRS